MDVLEGLSGGSADSCFFFFLSFYVGEASLMRIN